MLRVFGDTGFEVTRRHVDGVIEVEFELTPRRWCSTASPSGIIRRSRHPWDGSSSRARSPSSARPRGAARSAASSSGTCSRPTSRVRLPGQSVAASPSAASRLHSCAELADPSTLPSSACRAPRSRCRPRGARDRRAGALCHLGRLRRDRLRRRARQDELLALVRAHGARLVGPNCLGIASTATRLNATFARRAFPTGRIAFSSQSGALGLALLEQADARGLGLSAFVSIGNKADVSSNDLLEYWEDDNETDSVLLYLESFGNPRKFARVAGRVARSKPILAMRSGTSTRRRTCGLSHTAALAGSDAVVDALFRKAGVLRAARCRSSSTPPSSLTTAPPPAGNRVAVSPMPAVWGFSARTLAKGRDYTSAAE